MHYGWVIVVTAASTSTAAPDWLGFVAALGIGSLLGSLAVSIVGYINAQQGRLHEQQQRDVDRRHERELAEAEYQRRRADDRISQLRQGFIAVLNVVNAVLDLERWPRIWRPEGSGGVLLPSTYRPTVTA